MAQIEINKDEVLSAINVFNAAISEFESATDVFMDAAGNLDGQNSDFVNQMKSMVDDLTKLVNKEVSSKVSSTVVNATKDEPIILRQGDIKLFN